jgi:hypothetical protein
MMRKTNFRMLLIAATTSIVFFSCEEKEETPQFEQSEISVFATVDFSFNHPDPNARTTDLIVNNFAVKDVKLSIDNLKLILRGTNEDSKKPSIVQIRDKDPQLLNLVEDGQALLAPIGSVMAYDGIYGKLNFDLVQAKDIPEDDEMYGLSVIAKVEWSGIPAIFYLDLEDEVSLMFNKGIVVAGAQDFILTMYVDRFFDGLTPDMVKNENGDGVIEVGPNNLDGNAALYEAVSANIASSLDFRNGSFKE